LFRKLTGCQQKRLAGCWRSREQARCQTSLVAEGPFLGTQEGKFKRLLQLEDLSATQSKPERE